MCVRYGLFLIGIWIFLGSFLACNDVDLSDGTDATTNVKRVTNGIQPSDDIDIPTILVSESSASLEVDAAFLNVTIPLDVASGHIILPSRAVTMSNLSQGVTSVSYRISAMKRTRPNQQEQILDVGQIQNRYFSVDSQGQITLNAKATLKDNLKGGDVYVLTLTADISDTLNLDSVDIRITVRNQFDVDVPVNALAHTPIITESQIQRVHIPSDASVMYVLSSVSKTNGEALGTTDSQGTDYADYFEIDADTGGVRLSAVGAAAIGLADAGGALGDTYVMVVDIQDAATSGSLLLLNVALTLGEPVYSLQLVPNKETIMLPLNPYRPQDRMLIRPADIIKTMFPAGTTYIHAVSKVRGTHLSGSNTHDLKSNVYTDYFTLDTTTGEITLSQDGIDNISDRQAGGAEADRYRISLSAQQDTSTLASTSFHLVLGEAIPQIALIASQATQNVYENIAERTIVFSAKGVTASGIPRGVSEFAIDNTYQYTITRITRGGTPLSTSNHPFDITRAGDVFLKAGASIARGQTYVISLAFVEDTSPPTTVDTFNVTINVIEYAGPVFANITSLTVRVNENTPLSTKTTVSIPAPANADDDDLMYILSGSRYFVLDLTETDDTSVVLRLTKIFDHEALSGALTDSIQLIARDDDGFDTLNVTITINVVDVDDGTLDLAAGADSITIPLNPSVMTHGTILNETNLQIQGFPEATKQYTLTVQKTAGMNQGTKTGYFAVNAATGRITLTATGAQNIRLGAAEDIYTLTLTLSDTPDTDSVTIRVRIGQPSPEIQLVSGSQTKSIRNNAAHGRLIFTAKGDSTATPPVTADIQEMGILDSYVYRIRAVNRISGGMTHAVPNANYPFATSSTGNVTLVVGSSAEAFMAGTNYQVILAVYNGNTELDSVTFMVNVLANRAPTFSGFTTLTFTGNENSMASVEVPLPATDADGDALIYTIHSQPSQNYLNASITTNTAGDKIIFQTATLGNYEDSTLTNPVTNYIITVRVSDGTLRADQTVTVRINITDLNEPPTLRLKAGVSLSNNIPTNAVAGYVVLQASDFILGDPDATFTNNELLETYAMNNYFTIDANSNLVITTHMETFLTTSTTMNVASAEVTFRDATTRQGDSISMIKVHKTNSMGNAHVVPITFTPATPSETIDEFDTALTASSNIGTLPTPSVDTTAYDTTLFPGHNTATWTTYEVTTHADLFEVVSDSGTYRLALKSGVTLDRDAATSPAAASYTVTIKATSSTFIAKTFDFTVNVTDLP